MSDNRKRRPPLYLTEEQCGILLGLLGEAQRKIAFRVSELNRASGQEVDKELEFLRAQWPKFEALDNLLREHHPRRYDTSQDVDPDEWVVGDNDDNENDQ